MACRDVETKILPSWKAEKTVIASRKIGGTTFSWPDLDCIDKAAVARNKNVTTLPGKHAFLI
jgi:hypothetical protein